MAMEEDPLWLVLEDVRSAAERDDMAAVGSIVGRLVRGGGLFPASESPGSAAGVTRPGPDLGQRVPLLADLSAEEVLRLVHTLELRTVPAGTTVVREGDAGTSVFAVVFGAVEVVRRGPGGEGDVLAVLGPGDFFGEMALVARVPRLASVVTTAVTGYVELTSDHLASLSRTHPRIERLLLAHYKERLLDGLVASNPIVAAFGGLQRRALVDRVGIGLVEAGTALLTQGAPGTGLHVLLRGRCVVSGTTSAGLPIEYPDLHEGDLFGEISLLHDTDASATVTTAERSVIIGLSRRHFDELVLATPAVRDRLMELVDERLGRTFDLSTRTSPGLRARVL